MTTSVCGVFFHLLCSSCEPAICRQWNGVAIDIVRRFGWPDGGLYRRRDGARIGMSGDHINLPQAGQFGSHHPGQPRANVAVHASHVRMRRNVVRSILGKHDVTSRSAESCRIQVLHAAVGGGSNDEKIDPVATSTHSKANIHNGRRISLHVY